MIKVMYSSVYGFSNQMGFFYRIQGDSLISVTKKDCEHRIRSLFNAGQITRETRDCLLGELKGIKRP